MQIASRGLGCIWAFRVSRSDTDEKRGAAIVNRRLRTTGERASGAAPHDFARDARCLGAPFAELRPDQEILIHTRTAFIQVLALVSGLAAGCSSPALTSEPRPLEAGAGSGNAGSTGMFAGAGGASAAGSAGATIVPSGAGAGGAIMVTPPMPTAGAGGQAGTAGASATGGEPGTPISVPPVTPDPIMPGWTLAWSDEFNAADGTAVDPSHWHHDTGGNGWGNQELEYYTEDASNAEQRAGNLVITAKRDGASSHSCWYGSCQFTSARLLTSGKFSTAYGRVEARIKVPAGKGMWPAFWMLGDNIGDSNVGWPKCGEIDIMEIIGSEPGMLHGSMHGPGYSGGSPLTASTKLPSTANLSDDFHTYAVEWAPDSVKFYVDTTLYETRTPSDTPPGSAWVFNHPFFLILNVAVGGQWPGSPDASTPVPARMLVDYVRVLKAN